MSIEPYRAPPSHQITSGEEKKTGKFAKGQLQNGILEAVSAAVNNKIDAKALRRGLQEGHSLDEQIRKFTKDFNPKEMEDSIAKKLEDTVKNKSQAKAMLSFFHEKCKSILEAKDWPSYVHVIKV